MEVVGKRVSKPDVKWDAAKTFLDALGLSAERVISFSVDADIPSPRVTVEQLALNADGTLMTDGLRSRMVEVIVL